MQFDLIVGNPPFQETHADGTRKAPSLNLWSKFWSKSIHLAADDGTVVLVTPLRWMNPGPDLQREFKVNGHSRLWDVFNQFDSWANVVDVAKHFPGVGSSFGYVVVNKAGTDGLKFSNGVSAELGFMPLSGYDRVFEELSLTGNLGDTFGVDQKNSPTLRVSIPMTRVLKPEVLEILDGKTQPVMGNESAHNYAYVYAPDQETAERIRDRIIDCFDILSRHCRYSGFMSRDIVKMIRV